MAPLAAPRDILSPDLRYNNRSQPGDETFEIVLDISSPPPPPDPKNILKSAIEVRCVVAGQVAYDTRIATQPQALAQHACGRARCALGCLPLLNRGSELAWAPQRNHLCLRPTRRASDIAGREGEGTKAARMKGQSNSVPRADGLARNVSSS